MTPRELGPYLLLRKLSEDALSEIYRAGQKSGEDVERVVLLCFFKASRDDSTWLAETATVGRRALKGLSSPFLADVVDSGEEAGSAYLSYEYISGVGLPEVLERASREGAPVPVEVALHIVDRVAAGLLAAWEHESRMLHGFVVPQLVMLSNEGEVQLLGIEVASRLRRLLTDPALESEVRSYLAPEVVPQSQAATTDDVYSLGALLFALTTGKPLPNDHSDPVAQVDRAVTADGEELPEEVRQLLRTSLAPAQSRARLPEWHAELHELVVSERYDATSFNLALYLNRLFGEELDETADDEAAVDAVATDAASQTDSGPTAAAGEEAAPEPRAIDRPEELPAPSDVDRELATRGEEEERSGRRLVAAVGVVVLLAAGGTAYYLNRSGEPAPDQTADHSASEAVDQTIPPALGTTPNTAAPPTDATGPVDAAPEAGTDASPDPSDASAAATPTKEELDQRVDELVAKQSKEIEGALRDEYEREIAALRAQLEAVTTATDETAPSTDASEAETADSEPDAQPATSLSNTERVAEPEGKPATRTETRSPEIEDSGGETGGGRTDAAEPMSIATGSDQAIDSEAETAPGSTTEAAAGAAEDGGDAERVAREPSPAESTLAADSTAEPEPIAEKPTSRPSTSRSSQPSSTAPEEVPAASEPDESSSTDPAETPVRLGQLVSSGPGVESPQLRSSAQPVYPIVARRLGKTATIDLKILIDENGDVVEVEQVGAEAGFGFDAAAREAARTMKWAPAKKDGVRVKIWWPVRIAFEP